MLLLGVWPLKLLNLSSGRVSTTFVFFCVTLPGTFSCVYVKIG